MLSLFVCFPKISSFSESLQEANVQSKTNSNVYVFKPRGFVRFSLRSLKWALRESFLMKAPRQNVFLSQGCWKKYFHSFSSWALSSTELNTSSCSFMEKNKIKTVTFYYWTFCAQKWRKKWWTVCERRKKLQ